MKGNVAAGIVATGDEDVMAKHYPIGTLAQKTGIKVVTIRYYERIGLLSAPLRTQSNYRLYDETALRQLYFIRHCRELGFSLKEIKALFGLSGQTGLARSSIAAMARTRLAQLREEKAKLEEQCVHLEGLIRNCPNGSIFGCGIMDGLNEGMKRKA